MCARSTQRLWGLVLCVATWLAVVAVIVVLVAGGAGEEEPASSAEQCRHVYVMRHCVRGTGKPKESVQAYASLPFADWDTPDKWCLSGGYAITSSVGSYLREHFNLTAEGAFATSDDVVRKEQSAEAILGGLFYGKKAKWSVVTDAPIFNTLKGLNGVAADCEKPDETTQMKEVQELLETTPLPMGLGLPSQVDPAAWLTMLEQFQQILGPGTEDILTLTPPNFETDATWHKGKVSLGGSASVLKYFSQQLFYALAAGPGVESGYITFGGERLNASIDEVYPLYQWEAYARQVGHPRSLKVATGVALADAVLNALRGGGRSTHIFSNGDTQLDALRAIFNLAWDLERYGGSPGPTPPNTGLMFTKCSGDAVSIKTVYVTFDGTLAPPVRTGSAVPAETTLQELEEVFSASVSNVPAAAACASRLKIPFLFA